MTKPKHKIDERQNPDGAIVQNVPSPAQPVNFKLVINCAGY
ncbi:35199_t:CDS:1, partial [Racocetra persica]